METGNQISSSATHGSYEVDTISPPTRVDLMAYILMALRKTDLAQRVADALNKPIIYLTVRTFTDGECHISLERPTDYAGKDIVIIQSTGHPVNDNVLALAFCAQELKHAGALKITAIIPYFGYSRQERSDIEGKPGHGAVIARLLESSGIDEIVTIDLHAQHIIDFFSIPVRNLSARSLIIEHIKQYVPSLDTVCVVAPDNGIASYVKGIARALNVGTLLFSKERYADDKTRIVALDGGHCKGTTAIIIDDIIATGGTVVTVANSLPERGYTTIYGYCVHPVLAGNAVARLQGSSFEVIYAGNSLSLSSPASHEKFIKTFDLSPLIVEYLQGNNHVS